MAVQNNRVIIHLAPNCHYSLHSHTNSCQSHEKFPKRSLMIILQACMRYFTLIWLLIALFTTAKSQQLQPVYLGEISWHKVPGLQKAEPLPASITDYPAKKTVIQNTQSGIFQRKIDPGTLTLRNGPTHPIIQTLEFTGKKLPAPVLIQATPLQTRDNASFNISYQDKKHGFAAESVMDFAEDSSHNIWIASEKGLIRYDGYHYYLYELKIDLPNISDCSLAYDNQQRLWMSSENGVYMIRHDSLFTLKSPEIDLRGIACKRIMIDRLQRVWISTKNNGVLCIEGNRMSVYDQRCGLPGNYFESVYLDSKGNLYMACRYYGIVVIEPERMRMLFGKNKTMDYAIFLSFYENEEGIWAGSFLSGLMLLGKKDTLQYSVSGQFRESVYDIKKAPRGIWFSCYGFGLAYLNKKNLLLFNETNGLLNNMPYKLFEDSFQNIWVGNRSGFSRINEGCLYLEDFSNPAFALANSEFPDSARGGTWRTTFGRDLSFQKGKSATTYSFGTANGIRISSYSQAGLLDQDGAVWMSCYGEGVARLHNDTFSLYKYSTFTDHGIVNAIKKDGENKLWFCPTRFGLITYDNKKFRHFTTSSGLLSDDVRRLFLDPAKHIMWSMAEGVQRLGDAGMETLYLGNRPFKEGVNGVLYLDEHTSLWATNNRGLLLVKNEKVYQFCAANSICANSVNSIIQDALGRIWIVTENSVEYCVFEGTVMTNHVVFDKANGSYLINAQTPFLDSTGLPYWIAGSKKLVFNPDLVHERKNIPLFSIRQVALGDKTLSPKDKIVTYPDQKIELDYRTIYWGRESALALTYLLISSRNDTTERPVQNNGSIIISDVLPGNYRLLLKANDNRGVYYSSMVNIEIKNFWYNTWAFRLSMGVLLIAGIVFYFREKSRRQLFINERLAKKVEEQTAIIKKEKETLLTSYQTIEIQSKEKDTLIDEINHRVKNNLEFIAAMLDMQINNQRSPEATQALLGTNRRIKAMSLVHELLYLKKDLKGLSMHAYIHELVDNLKEMATDDSNPVNIETEVDDVVIDSKTALSLGMIISELVSNSFKHAFLETPEPEVRILLKRDEQTGTFHLMVSDNGKGYRQPTGFSNGLGTRLVDIFSRQLEGIYTMETAGHFTYQLQFKPIGT
jgi:two-component sensor histidine kinase/ligand-binding sensor domain-containing protein